MGNGSEFFWIAERVVNQYPWFSKDERDEVIAEAVYAAYVVSYPLSYALMIWCVRRAISMHVVLRPRYPHIPLHLVRDKVWHVAPPEIPESNLVDLTKYRQRKFVANLPQKSGR